MNMGRLVVVFLIAAVIAGGVFYLTSRMQPVQVQTGPVTTVSAQPSEDVVQVLVAVAALPAGTLIKQGAVSFGFRPWPRSAVDQESYVVEGGGAIEDFDGAVIRVGMNKGEPVNRANLIKKGDSGFLAAVIHPGMRAVSISVNENTGLAGFVFPGDRVDLVLSHVVNLMHSDDAAHTHNVSETILHDLRVVAVDQKAGDQEQTPAVSSVVTLEVTPEQAERISLAQRMGELRLVLRSMVVNENGQPEEGGSPLNGGVVPPESRTFTLDSDLSQIITPPGGDEDTGARIQVVRGNASEEAEAK